MTTAVDTSVLLDILIDDPLFAEKSVKALQRCSEQGRLIVCECVVSELMPTLRTGEELVEFLSDLNIDFVPSTQQSAIAAGQSYVSYLNNKGQQSRVLPDFLIAAHARSLADQLLARDRGYYRTYFAGLNVVSPL